MSDEALEPTSKSQARLRKYRHGMAGPRSREQRRVDTLRKLEAEEADVWVATSGDKGAHLVPLSYAWVGDRILIACEDSSLTARNVLANGAARLGFGPTRDVVMIDATLERSEPIANVAEEVAAAYERQAGWDARGVPNNLLLSLRPMRIQAWREADEIAGRTLMRNGAWLV
jgi:hypothetical protein